jgi:PAS domain S-box-containing protein
MNKNTVSSRRKTTTLAGAKELISTALDPIIAITALGSIESVNPAFTKMFGYSGDEVIGKNIKMLMPEPFHSEHDGYLSNYQKTGDKKVIGIGREVIAQRKDGSTFPIHLSVSEYKVGEDKFYTGIIRDLTAVKEVERKMFESEAKTKELVNTALDPIITITDRGIIDSVNSAFTKMFGYSGDDVIGKNIKMLMPEPFHSEHDGYLSNYKNTGNKKVIGIGREVVAKRMDGSTFPIHLSVNEYTVNNNKFYTGTIRDLTAIKENEDYLTELVDKAELISTGDYMAEIKPRSDQDQLGIALQRMTNVLRNVSKFAVKLAEGDFSVSVEKQSSSDLLADSMNKLVTQLKSVTEENARKAWISSGISGINDVTRGETDLRNMATAICQYLAKYLQAQIMTLYVAEGNTLRLTGSYAFNKRKSLGESIEFGEGLVGQAALERETISITDVPQDYSRISSSIGDSYPRNIVVTPFVTDDTVLGVLELGVFSELSDMKLELLDSLREPVAIMIRSVFAQTKTKELLEETQRQAEELQSQQEKLKKSNEGLQEQTRRLKQSEEELRQQSEELQVSNEELEEKQEALTTQKNQVEAAKKEVEINARELALASKYKSEFLANMSHELRTPLNSLLLLSKGLSGNKKGNLTQGQVEDAQVIYEGGNDLLALINDIMDLSKVEAGMLNVHIEELKLATLTRNLQKVFDPVADDRGLIFKIDIDDTVPEIITSDAQRVEQILKNLLSNAMKFTENGSVTLKIQPLEPDVRFRQSGLNRDSAIAFAVTDTGVGIPADKQQAIFEAFQQQDGSTSRKYGGTGLGLTISRELARLLNGEIRVQSYENEGSTFTLYLPKDLKIESVDQARGGTSPDSARDGMSKRPIRSMSNQYQRPITPVQPAAQFIADDRKDIIEGDKTLLIIDDDKKYAKILRDHGRSNGYKCVVAGDGRSGIQLAAEYVPSGILLDIGLPDIDGHHVLEQLKFSLQTRHIPVQIISGYGENKNKSLRQGAMGHLTKPVEQEQLNTALENIAAIAKTDVRNILIVEDDKGNQQAIRGILKSSGVNIKCVDTGKKACTEILSNTYDCVILDIGLPDMSGFDVLKTINDDESKSLPPIIIYTGKEITDEENTELEKYAATIVVKGAGSPERLLDDTSLFMHSIDSTLQKEGKDTIRMLHDEDAMLKNRKILLVDDDMKNTYALSKKLIEVGLNVDMAKHGQEALEQLEKDATYELVLMDVMMPVMDGYEATQRIRKMPDYKDIPVVALTAKAMREDREKCLEAGASEYLVKPIDFEKLLSIMRIWLFKHT